MSLNVHESQSRKMLQPYIIISKSIKIKNIFQTQKSKKVYSFHILLMKSIK